MMSPFKKFLKPAVSIFLGFVILGALPAGLPPVWADIMADSKPLVFIAVGDTGTGSDGQKKVADAMAATIEREKVTFILLLGDNFYTRGVKSTKDKAWKRKFEDIYHHPAFQIPFYAVLGNHDYGKKNSPRSQIDYSKVSDRWIMPAKYYTFSKKLDDSTDIQFFALDTMTLEKKKGRKTQLKWIEEELAKSRARWKVVFAHHPVYAGGKHGDMEILQRVLEPLLIKYGVDLYLCGHEHVLEAIKPISGINYVISGAGSGTTRIKKRPEDYFSSSYIGFVLLRASKEKIDIDFISAKKETLYSYSISKPE